MAVIFGEAALSEQILGKILSYSRAVTEKFQWNCNIHFWPEGLINTHGVVMTHMLSAEATIAIFRDLRANGHLSYLPKEKTAMIYSWLPGSGIAWHPDYGNKSSMTIYLNREWRPDHGGYFCWKDWGEDLPQHTYDYAPTEGRIRMPQFNHYVYMNDAEWHCTTITSTLAPPRLSLQMFFDKE